MARSHDPIFQEGAESASSVFTYPDLIFLSWRGILNVITPFTQLVHQVSPFQESPVRVPSPYHCHNPAPSPSTNQILNPPPRPKQLFTNTKHNSANGRIQDFVRVPGGLTLAGPFTAPAYLSAYPLYLAPYPSAGADARCNRGWAQYCNSGERASGTTPWRRVGVVEEEIRRD
ncbi:hypothetical protein BDK51DRAFT_47843 [Blyttiomyces helicus]|uniref:Uncharacterized protein n=1 Tax=Blyttiomyces helicus TaxID=388810 RepID=A0A4P9VXX7_9FUNG|nr:hypothetical protein BDK51DRAFT_47843 [Blyttiomyces helicus]|eukprot:RKO83583.1 hypothetical protein BDK51DRAFT_47843 [Blyttiomyces helicus]